MKIMADYREKPSGIIEMLIEAGLDVAVGKVSCGDYIINNRITLERKTASDFVVSIISGRLFKQAVRLKTNAKTPLLLVEGNPFKTEINISHTAVRGAILTIQSLFYLPIVYGRSKKETVDVISHMARLVEKNTDVVPLRGGYYQDESPIGQLTGGPREIEGWTAGTGLNFNRVVIDVAFERRKSEGAVSLFLGRGQGAVNAEAPVETVRDDRVVASVMYRFGGDDDPVKRLFRALFVGPKEE